MRGAERGRQQPERPVLDPQLHRVQLAPAVDPRLVRPGAEEHRPGGAHPVRPGRALRLQVQRARGHAGSGERPDRSAQREPLRAEPQARRLLGRAPDEREPLELEPRRRFFENANLQGANLQGSNLRDADLPTRTLQGASLQGSNLNGCRPPAREPERRASPGSEPERRDLVRHDVPRRHEQQCRRGHLREPHLNGRTEPMGGRLSRPPRAAGVDV